MCKSSGLMGILRYSKEEDKRIKKHNSIIIYKNNKIVLQEIENLIIKNQINKIIKKFKIKYEMKSLESFKSFEFLNWNNKKINK